MEEYVQPDHKAKAFNCPYTECRTYAQQRWVKISAYIDFIEGISISICQKCKRYAIWIDNVIVYPIPSPAPLPAKDMPDDVKINFEEARHIVTTSPRAAAALLRLALERLLVHLKAEGRNNNEKIGNLVDRGLPKAIQRACDAVRVIGNEAVHPGKIDFKDNEDIALALFTLMNIIVETMITESRKIDKMYDEIPESIKKSIEKRDKIHKNKGLEN